MGVLVFLTSAAWVVTIYESRLHATMDAMGMSTAAPLHGSLMVSSGPTHDGMMMPGMPMGSAASTEASTAHALEAGLSDSLSIASSPQVKKTLNGLFSSRAGGDYETGCAT